MKCILIGIFLPINLNCFGQNGSIEPIRIEFSKNTKIEIFSFYLDKFNDQTVVSIYFDFSTEEKNTDIIKYINFIDVNNTNIEPYYTTELNSQNNNYSGILLYIVDAKKPKIKWQLSVNSKESTEPINMVRYLNLQNLETPKTLLRKLETYLVLANYNFNLENKGEFVRYTNMIDTVNSINENMGDLYPFWIFKMNKELSNDKKIGDGNTIEFLEKAMELGCKDSTIIKKYFYYLKSQADLFYDKDKYKDALNYYSKIDSAIIENPRLKNLKLVTTSSLDSVKFYKLFCDYVLNIDQILEKEEYERKSEVKLYIQKFIPFENKQVKYHAYLVLGNLNFYNKNYGEAEEYYNKIINSTDFDAKQYVNSANDCKSNIPKN